MVLVQDDTQPSVEEFSTVGELAARLLEVKADQKTLLELNPYCRCSIFLFSGSRWHIEPYPWKLVTDDAAFELDTGQEVDTPTDSFWAPRAPTEEDKTAKQKTDDGEIASE